MRQPWLRGSATALLAAMLAACSHPAPMHRPPATVGVITTQVVNVPVVRTYPGRLAATLTAQVRARVTGIVLKRAYTEGSDVKAGDVLFQIDPAPLEATLRSQEGVLAQAEATARDDAIKAKRDKQLGATGQLDRQSVDDAIAAAAVAKAAVKSAKANVENAKINLAYATVTSPISGRAGMANVTEGALVKPTDTTPLTTVQQIDPIYANFSEPVAEMEKLRLAEKSNNLQLGEPDKARVHIILPDGSVYDHAGRLDFSGISVDPGTGAVKMRAVIPNPHRALLPGMFVTVRLTIGMRKHVFLLPQAAIQRDNDGAYVLVVGTGNKVALQRVTLGDEHGADWLVTGGIEPGEHVIVSGVQKAHPGEEVKTVAYRPDANHSSGGVADD